MRERSLLIFMIVALGIALPAIVAVWRMDRLALHMAMNQYHGPFMDLVFPYITSGQWLAYCCTGVDPATQKLARLPDGGSHIH